MTATHWHDVVYLMSGKTIVGGLVRGLLTVELVKRIIGEKVSTGDLFAATIALGLAIGRMGCFLGGLSDDTYGTPTSLACGIDFGDGVQRHPTQLCESIFALGLFFFLWRMMKRRHQKGDVFKAFMVTYAPWRLAIDYLKPEFRMAGLSGLQGACAATLVYCVRDISRWVQRRVQFIDAYSFDVRSVKKTCIHIVHPDGGLIPFDTYNLFYFDALQQTRLESLRQWAAGMSVSNVGTYLGS